MNDFEETPTAAGLVDITAVDLKKRGISMDTCARYGYGVGTVFGNPMQVANYRRKGQVVSQHARDADKNFYWLNASPGAELFGQHLWEEGGKTLIITEGEIDCLTWAQARNHKWPVVGVPGTGSIKMIKQQLEWIASFDEVVLYFDTDEPGQAFAQEVAALLPPGRCRIGGTTPYKDSNELVLAKGESALMATLWQAKTWHPAELVSAFDVLAEKPSSVALHYSWPEMDEMTGGLREYELTLVTAGTNVGKSFVLKNLCHQFLSRGLRVGFVALEESSRSVLETLIGFELGIEQSEVVKMSEEEQLAALQGCHWSENISFYADQGQDLSEVLLPRLRYMAQGQGCDLLMIDHISKVFSTFNANQRQEIDSFMYELQSLGKEIGKPIFAAAHLRDPAMGVSHNEGGEPKLSQLNGSSSISRVPDTVWGVQRSTQDPSSRHLTKLVLLKSRYRGMRVGDYLTLATDNGPMLTITSEIEIDDDF